MPSTSTPQPALSFLVGSFLLGAIGFLLFFFFCWKGSTTAEQKDEKPSQYDSHREEKIYTAAEIAQHAKEDDAWIIVDGKVLYTLVAEAHDSLLLLSFFSFFSRDVCGRSTILPNL